MQTKKAVAMKPELKRHQVINCGKEELLSCGEAKVLIAKEERNPEATMPKKPVTIHLY